MSEERKVEEIGENGRKLEGPESETMAPGGPAQNGVIAGKWPEPTIIGDNQPTPAEIALAMVLLEEMLENYMPPADSKFPRAACEAADIARNVARWYLRNRAGK